MALTNNTGEVPSHLLAGWFDTALGKYLLGREMAYFEAAIADIFGFHALQIGLPAHDFLRGSRIAARHVLDLD